MALNNKSKTLKYMEYAVMAVILLVLAFALTPENQCFDSKYYADLSQSFFKKASAFSLVNFAKTIRGCLMPLLLCCGQSVLGILGIPSISAISLCGTITLALSVAFIVRVIFPDKNYIIAAFGVSVLFFVFFKDLIVYALSDLYALEAACVGISGIYLTGKLLDDKKRFAAVCIALFSGACLYFAYNTRTIYSFTMILGILLFVFLNFRHKAWCAICLVLIGLGIFAMGLPQMIVNQVHFGKFSLVIDTTYEGYDSLFLFQLEAGLGLQRFTAYPLNGSFVGVMFPDNAGILLQQQLAAMGPMSYINYIILFLTNPLQMLGVYVRHFLTMISIFSNEVYIHTLSFTTLMLTLGYSVQYLVVCNLVMGIRNKQYTFKTFLSKKMLYVYTIVFAGLVIIPGAIEGRFAIPLFMVMFIYLVCACSWKQLFADFKKHWLMYCASYLVVYLLFCSFWSTSLATS